MQRVYIFDARCGSADAGKPTVDAATELGESHVRIKSRDTLEESGVQVLSNTYLAVLSMCALPNTFSQERVLK